MKRNAWFESPTLSKSRAAILRFTDSLLVLFRKNYSDSCHQFFSALSPELRLAFEHAVSLFSPYSEMREANNEVRATLRDLLIRAKRRAEQTFIFVNNRPVGFAPGTIAVVTNGM